MRRLVLVLILAVAVLPGISARAAHSGETGTTCIDIPVGTPPNAVAQAAPEGAQLCFAPGLHRISQPIRPKSGQILAGTVGSVLSGAVVLEGFTPVGGGWWTPHHYDPAPPKGICDDKTGDGCTHAETVFIDNEPLRRAASPALVRPGFFHADGEHVWIGENPAGKTIEFSVVRAAVAASAPHVTVKGLTIEKFANPAQMGAIQCADGWLVENNEVRLNHGVGIAGWARTVIRGNHVHHNGQLGMSARGESIMVEKNEINHNNTAGFDTLWEAGGTKFLRTTSLIVRENYSHHNFGPGLWADIDNVGVLFEDNLVRKNRGPGIFAEISYGVTIRSNKAIRNGAGYPGWAPAGILVLSTSDVVITENLVRGNRGGVMLIHDGRPAGPLGPYDLRDILVMGNLIRSREGMTGMTDWTGAKEGRGVVFRDNTYYSSLERPFMWQGTQLTPRQWRLMGHS